MRMASDVAACGANRSATTRMAQNLRESTPELRGGTVKARDAAARIRLKSNEGCGGRWVNQLGGMPT